MPALAPDAGLMSIKQHVNNTLLMWRTVQDDLTRAGQS
jgi:hypothetical protein